jgi:Second Messenger Oligonucleotide or Dinucleotide Synthetase domain
MNNETLQQFGGILRFIINELDVPEDVYAEAVRKYQRLGDWFKRDNENQYRTDSEIYPQGSVRIGTMIRPIREGDEYDVDLVYCRDLAKEGITQADLKKQAAEQLRRHIEHLRNQGEEVPELEAGRRCWTLLYKKRFHMDVLPAIPDDESIVFNVRDREHGILITDKELWNWQHSNPRGYANWFAERERAVLLERRAVMARAAKVDVERIPIERVKTPLRTSVQILKRHRDIRFEGNREDKPISIIITTLAARVYGGEVESLDALLRIVGCMRKAVEKRNGEYWVPNPINPQENFADKWKEEPEKANCFFEWVAKVEADLSNALKQTRLDRIAESLEPIFGRDVVRRGMKRYGQQLDAMQQRGELRMAPQTGLIGTVGTAIRKNTWYGG